VPQPGVSRQRSALTPASRLGSAANHLQQPPTRHAWLHCASSLGLVAAEACPCPCARTWRRSQGWPGRSAGPGWTTPARSGLFWKPGATFRLETHGSGAIFQVRWSGAASGARPRYVRVRMVSRFSALQKTCKNIEMAANASVFQL
jgi:hypothetical protein